jgi:hypothetical protein
MYILMIVSSIFGALVALIGFASYASDIQLTIGFVGSAWCLISAGVAAVLGRLGKIEASIAELRPASDESYRERVVPEERYNDRPRERYRDERRDPDFR